ncbi:MAG TPA: PD-(D/E)XK nuclease family protein, partial [Thermomicrobiales bacterium]|nr:PD-(D/E)XK nuclease family protein [Thermomicrobiales bacterium]
MMPIIPAIAPDPRVDPQSITPTDVSQFIRLDQCERYLRLRLHERATGSGFMREYDVVPQAIPPILTRSGAEFEATIERDLGYYFPLVKFTEAGRQARGQTTDNQAVSELARDLAPGEAKICLQPRLEAILNGWKIRGDVDILRLERDEEGTLTVLIADMKASTAAKIEHRLQVAFYHELLTHIFAATGIAHGPIELAILYRGPAATEDGENPAEVDELHIAQQELAFELFGTRAGLLERIDDAQPYVDSVRDLVIGSQSTARRVLATPFDEIPFHLTYKCDGCLFNEFCMNASAETDDLSLLPHITEQDKGVLRREGIATVRELATLKELRRKGQIQVDGEVQEETILVPAPAKDALSRRLAATWPVGPRIDELIHRAKRYRKWIKDPMEALDWIPHKGYGSLPWSDETQNPNLVRVFIDAQHDYLHDRLYMAGALVVGNEGGFPNPARRRSAVSLSDAPPDSAAIEERLLVDWIANTLQAVVEVAAPDPEGNARAPIHLVFINDFAQQVLLAALGRHASTILGATALYDFVTQLAAFDSPLITFLDRQIREQKNYPMICQSLQAVAAFRHFDWNEGIPYRKLFRARMFDFWGRLDEPDDDFRAESWFTNRARFNSQIPLEFAYNAWGELPRRDDASTDEMAPYRTSTPALLAGFHGRRLEAMEWIANDFRGNKQT